MSFVAPQDLEDGTSGMATLATGTVLREFRLHFVTKGGGVRSLSWTTVPDGDRLYGFARDVTAEVTTAAALEASRAERERLWKVMVGEWPAYEQYAEKTDREIPVVVLTPR